jgi:hypothetical protein
MDWATFFKDFGQSLFTLGGVFLGSAITFLINYINLRNQSREREIDRQEQRRELNVVDPKNWRLPLGVEFTRKEVYDVQETQKF